MEWIHIPYNAESSCIFWIFYTIIWFKFLRSILPITFNWYTDWLFDFFHSAFTSSEKNQLKSRIYWLKPTLNWSCTKNWTQTIFSFWLFKFFQLVLSNNELYKISFLFYSNFNSLWFHICFFRWAYCFSIVLCDV
jgi:hypothetical protein